MLLHTFLSCSFLINVHFDLKWNSLSTQITFEGIIVKFFYINDRQRTIQREHTKYKSII